MSTPEQPTIADEAAAFLRNYRSNALEKIKNPAGWWAFLLSELEYTGFKIPPELFQAIHNEPFKEPHQAIGEWTNDEQRELIYVIDIAVIYTMRCRMYLEYDQKSAAQDTKTALMGFLREARNEGKTSKELSRVLYDTLSTGIACPYYPEGAIGCLESIETDKLRQLLVSEQDTATKLAYNALLDNEQLTPYLQNASLGTLLQEIIELAFLRVTSRISPDELRDREMQLHGFAKVAEIDLAIFHSLRAITWSLFINYEGIANRD